MTSFVLDNSVVLSWCLADEDHPLADRAMELAVAGGAVAPRIWWYELRNALIVNERRGRLSPAHTGAALTAISRLGIVLDSDHDEAALFELTRTRRLTVYDAAYLEVAMRRRLAIATLDRRLHEAATANGVALVGENRSTPPLRA